MDGTARVEVKFVDMCRNADDEIVHWTETDAEVRKPGERTGLDTLVVPVVNDDYWVWAGRLSVPKRMR